MASVEKRIRDGKITWLARWRDPDGRQHKASFGKRADAARHAAAMEADTARESVVAVAEWLGHDVAGLVLSTYGHLMPNSEDRMRKAIDGAYAEISADSRAPCVPQSSAVTRWRAPIGHSWVFLKSYLPA